MAWVLSGLGCIRFIRQDLRLAVRSSLDPYPSTTYRFAGFRGLCRNKGTAFVRSNVELLGVHFDKSLPVRLVWDFCFFTYFVLIFSISFRQQSTRLIHLGHHS